MNRLILCIALMLLAGFVASCSAENNDRSEPLSTIPIGNGFDFYVLSLSWSPGYCASEGNNADSRQCGPDKKYEFVVHGLWPQFERGYPENCNSNNKLDNSLVSSMTDIMPSFGLIKHQWRKHGSCSGLSPEEYFSVTRAAFSKISLPPSFSGLTETKTISPISVEKLFQAENPDIPNDGIAATCKRKYLRDVRICMTKDLASFRSCPEIDRNYCRSRSMAVAPLR
ncbi:ribonuclease T [Ahrensia sp. 13_GOM-1096m]|uniref:ribonuclease T2 family protein n=1 Tax=Ahrensia sp. 13_GOM-1096m TaxID=1380380 RepID=UPI000478AF55